MPFHVEVSSPISRARVLNLDTADVQRAVLEPWVAGVPFEFGEHEWAPRESRLTILEGAALAAREHDQGWESALRGAEDVTRPLLEAAEASSTAQTAVVVEADSVDEGLRALREGSLPERVAWSTAAEWIAGRDSELRGVILVVRRPRLSRPRI
jgi:hypothetical protein